jgi:predicted GH43/DUF377 family glycosyl hydrolase
MRTHAANPTPERLGNGYVRVYFSARDVANRSSVGWVEIDIAHPTRVRAVSEVPVLGPGVVGSFDDSGVTVACMVESEPRYLYYVGWNLGVTAPWRNSIGLAVGAPGHAPVFARFSAGPILDRCPADPYSLSYPCVTRENGGWRMWYGSNLTWGAAEENMTHAIKHAVSADGIVWARDGKAMLSPSGPGEYALARPCVVREPEGYSMWYSRRGERYRIGYAHSRDGVNWERRDAEAGIEISEEGWDSESIEYPYVFEENGMRYMLYNGNDYGRTGFGIAVLE